MADSNEKEKNITAAPVEEKTDSTEVSPNKKPSCTPCITKITLLIAFIALAITGYNYYCGMHFSKENKELIAQVQQLKQEQKNVEQDLNKKASLLENNHQTLETKISDFSKQVQAMRQKGNQSQDWLLLKARYYLELAQINAHWMDNSNDKSTEVLLQQADITLGQMNAAELFKIRQIIAKELLQLKTASHLDMPGLLSQLDALQTSIGQLHLQKTLSLQADLVNSADKASTTGPTVSNWKTQFNNSLDILGKLVVVRRSDEEIKPLLSPIFESLLKESLRINIQEAQWAIINRNPVAYQLALKQAIGTLQRGFSKQLSNTSTLIQQLKDLEKINLVAEKIEVGQALPLINELLEQRQLANPEEKASKTGGQEQ